MIAEIQTCESVGSVIERMFSRGDLPAQVAVMEARKDIGIKVGDVLTWREDLRGFETADGRFMVSADYVRYRWCLEFCWAPPPKPAQLLLLGAAG